MLARFPKEFVNPMGRCQRHLCTPGTGVHGKQTSCCCPFWWPFLPNAFENSVSLSGLCIANCLLRMDAEQATGASSLWKEGSGWRVDLRGYPSRHCSLHGWWHFFILQSSSPGHLMVLSHQGSPKSLEWVAYLFSRGSS